MSRFLASLVLLGTLFCWSALGNAQSRPNQSETKDRGTWVPIIKVTTELKTTDSKEETCYEVVISERERAIAEENKKSTLKRWFTSSNPAAKSVKPGEYLENQRFFTETVCKPMVQNQYHHSPYFVTYEFNGKIQMAEFAYYPREKILVLEDGTVVDALNQLR